MNNYYGNLFHDANIVSIAMELYFNYLQSPADEINLKRYENFTEQIKRDLAAHQNDPLPFTFNYIKRVCELVLDMEEKVDFLYLVKDLFKSDTSIEKLKALAKIKLTSKHEIPFNDLQILFPAYGMFVMRKDNPHSTNEDLKSAAFSMTIEERILNTLVGLTPNQVFGLFPIRKEYDGEKTGCKDYFYCMEKAKEIGLDKPMTEDDVRTFIMECTLDNLLFYVGVGLMTIVSDYNNWSLYDMRDAFLEGEHSKKKEKFKVIK